METMIDAPSAVRRLLVRTGFAADSDQVTAAVAAGFTATVDKILDGGDDPGATATPPPDFLGAARPNKGADTKTQMKALTLWWLDRMVAAEQPWTERRTLLWHGHWATAEQKVHWPQAMLQQNETQRQLGAGSFDVFGRAMIVDPALMIWLDANGNTARAPNENLAREFMELFALGHGNYTEEDVRQAALALTGWRINANADIPVATYQPERHATGMQKILGTTKSFTASDFVDLLVARPASLRYLATRMWGWLVSTTPPSARSLDRITTAYGKTYDLTGMFRAIITDPAFLDSDSVLVKSPIEYVVGALRSLGLRPTLLPTKVQTTISAAFTGMGQVPFEPPNVGGWPVGGAWLTTAAAQSRIKLAAALARTADISAVATASPAKRPDAAAHLLGLGGWTGRTRAVLASAAADPEELVTLALVAPEYTVSG